MVSSCHCLFLLLRVVSYIPHAPWSTVRDPTLPTYTASWQRSWHVQMLQRWYHNFNMNFESCSFRQSKKIACGSSLNLSQMVKVDECQDTITTQLETCHLSKSGLNEAELILSRAGPFVVTKDQVEQMVICPQHRHKLGKFWRPPRSCQYPSHSGPRKKHCNERHVIGLEAAKNIQSVFKVTVGIGSRKN